MKITIIGAGRVGVHLAKYFANEQQDVYLVDCDSTKLAMLESDYNMRTFVGESIDYNVLWQANSHNADVFVAVTGSTAENLVACAMAKSMGAKKTIARVNRPNFRENANEDVLHKMGVDHVVFPDYIAAQAVISSLDHPWCRSWNNFYDNRIILAAVSVNEESPIVGKYLRELISDSELLHISALRRRHETIIPGGNDRIAAGDLLYITSTVQGLDKVMALTGKKKSVIRKVIIMGGSNIARLVVNEAGKRFSFVIIEKDIDRCRELTETCVNGEIIYGDGSEEDVLQEAGINKCDAFVALSDVSESNVLACLTAKEAGVVRTIAEVEKERLIERAEAFRLGQVVNKPILTAHAIFQLILEGDDESSKCFVISDAEVVRMEISEDSSLTRSAVKDLNLPSGITFAGLVRDGEGQLVTGATRFRGGDKVIVFCLPGTFDKVEKLFRK